jgi:hypothetical protein
MVSSRTQHPPPPSLPRNFALPQGRGGELNQREGYRGNSSQSWIENINTTLINTCRKVPLLVKFFLDDVILHWCLLVHDAVDIDIAIHSYACLQGNGR